MGLVARPYWDVDVGHAQGRRQAGLGTPDPRTPTVMFYEIDRLELEIALQLYREHVNRMDERLTEFRHIQELP